MVRVSTQLLKSACGKSPSAELWPSAAQNCDERVSSQLTSWANSFWKEIFILGSLNWVWSDGKNTKLQILRYGLVLSRFMILPKLIRGTQTLDGRNIWTFMWKSFFFPSALKSYYSNAFIYHQSLDKKKILPCNR